MKCPTCGRNASIVLDSRKVRDYVKRKRECPKCGRKWTTYELNITKLVNVSEQLGMVFLK